MLQSSCNFSLKSCSSSSHPLCIYLFTLKDFIYLFIFRERVREEKRRGEKHQCVVASHMRPTGDLAYNPDMCPDWESNLWPFGSQAGTQSTEPHQPGLHSFFIRERRRRKWEKAPLKQHDLTSPKPNVTVKTISVTHDLLQPILSQYARV